MSDPLTIELRHQGDYRFEAVFNAGRTPALTTDLGPPLGQAAGPDPEQLLASAIATCLSSSLLFALRKFGNAPPPLVTRATAIVVRNEQKRMRVGRIEVTIDLGVPAATLVQLERVLAQYEEFCTVTQSVRAAIPVQVKVVDGDGVAQAG